MSKQNSDLFLEGLLRIGDDNFILGHRTSEWCGHAPTLEEDLALPNIALDLIGHAQSLYIMASEIAADGKDEDAIAFLRLENEYKNLLLVEQENGNFGNTILRLYYFSTYMKFFWRELKVACCYQPLREFAEKAYQETSYHVKHTSQWVIRLGDGTEESHSKMVDAVYNIQPFLGELFFDDSFSKKAYESNFFPEQNTILQKWKNDVHSVFNQSGMELGQINLQKKGGRSGEHTETFGYILSDLQYMQRTFPNSKW
jgi:ring-1,2-phenylacetyl-CoA epoxidase subunit PaaC